MKLFKEYQGLIESVQKILDEAKSPASEPAGDSPRTKVEIEEAESGKSKPKNPRRGDVWQTTNGTWGAVGGSSEAGPEGSIEYFKDRSAAEAWAKAKSDSGGGHKNPDQPTHETERPKKKGTAALSGASAEDLAYMKKDFADMVKVFKKKIAKMERLIAKLNEKLRNAETPKIKAKVEDRLYTETHSLKWHKEWLRDAEAKAKKGDYDSLESAVDDLSAWAEDEDY